MVHLLVAAGADVNRCDAHGTSPLAIAAAQVCDLLPAPAPLSLSLSLQRF